MEQQDPTAAKRRPGRPATGQTPVRTVRIGPVWDRCVELATSRGEKMTRLVERALEAEEKKIRRTEGTTK